ncbi:MAG: cupin domain-containing protein, partial [Rubrivivax sp.]
GKAHPWHEHPVDETILVIEGRLRFMHAETETICLPGDAIFLPARTRHGSVALQEGAIYVIALRPVEFA